MNEHNINIHKSAKIGLLKQLCIPIVKLGYTLLDCKNGMPPNIPLNKMLSVIISLD